jgi:hypothetical protein
MVPIKTLEICSLGLAMILSVISFESHLLKFFVASYLPLYIERDKIVYAPIIFAYKYSLIVFYNFKQSNQHESLTIIETKESLFREWICFRHLFITNQ